MKPSLDQCLVFVSIAAAIAYFVIGAIRKRRNKAGCGGSCGCSAKDFAKTAVNRAAGKSS